MSMRIQTLLARGALVLAIGCGLLQPALAALPIQKWQQASGAQVWLVEAPGLPILDVEIDFDAGERRNPPEKAGLAAVTADMAGKGIEARNGEPALDENQLGEAWADLGAGFGGSAGADRMSFTLRTLTYPDLLTKAVNLAAREIGEPAFPDSVWQRDRQRMVASIREANTRPATIAGRAFAKAVYGGHPYGYETTEESLGRITVQDMREFYRLVQPCRAKVSIVGAVNRAQADQIATTMLSRLPASTCQPLAPVPEVQALGAAAERDVPFASAQAHVLIGQPGYKRDDADYFPLLVGNYVLGGGGFVSRLNNEVRQKRGLSYSVYSYFSPGMHAGAFTVGLQTRPDQAAQAVQVSRDVVRSFVQQGPTAEELKAAKDNLVGGFALRIDSNRKLLDNVANIAWYDLPLDYLDTWTRQVEKVTAADIKAAFARKLQPDRMVTVVVGGAVAAARQ
ncbi:MAG: zinc protease protein-like protein [Ramlibacter sp.]|nr:zinc protease protein-like protein [Ramlibacter sp.]